ncbi:hypothetical protein H257_13608 [Aphanomyces astaci]|uniref:Uncharacterized protein n=1 Tax=Aphanomyces astaci TaxID=112090 RepID=W4FTM8_APHAT|nr:hypothetical protein H257_13608 [Aphanomyces astaci]ETV70817.1 hypothetical protein H257_13608 [Aphanomyces astaci]|eukprot:XP_009839480.1 hypothetical protein H257_13608 [Aphanomyces astaci]
MHCQVARAVWGTCTRRKHVEERKALPHGDKSDKNHSLPCQKFCPSTNFVDFGCALAAKVDEFVHVRCTAKLHELCGRKALPHGDKSDKITLFRASSFVDFGCALAAKVDEFVDVRCTAKLHELCGVRAHAESTSKSEKHCLTGTKATNYSLPCQKFFDIGCCCHFRLLR